MNALLHRQLAASIEKAGHSVADGERLISLLAALTAIGATINAFDLLDAALKQPQLFYQKPATLAGNVAESAQRLGLTTAQFTAAALKQPSLFSQKPATLAGNVAESAQRLGLTTAQFTAAALEQPSLFYQKPATLAGNVAESAQRLGLTTAQFAAAALKQPQLFCQKPATLAGNVAESAQRLGLTTAQFTAAALKQPSLFYQKPTTLAGNVAESAQRLGLTTAQFAAAALKQPPLFGQKPATLAGNVAESAQRLGLTTAQFTAAALKKPQLFYQKPATLAGKKSYIEAIATALAAQDGFAATIQTVPVALSLSHSYLHARYVLAKLGLKRGAVGSVVGVPSAKTTTMLTDYFVRRIAVTGKGKRALQVMQAQGLIATLPPGIAPIAKPVRSVSHPSCRAAAAPV